jgi:hypothetical protein
VFNTILLQKNLVAICANILGDTVTNCIVAEQAGPRPIAPYLTLKVLGSKQIGGATWRESETLDMFDIITDNELLVSISTYGANAQDLLSTLLFHLTNNILVSDQLAAVGLSLSEKPSVVDKTLLLETKFEQRRMCTAKFMYTHLETVDYGVIEHITVNSEYKSGSISGNTVLEDTITVDKPSP